MGLVKGKGDGNVGSRLLYLRGDCSLNEYHPRSVV